MLETGRIPARDKTPVDGFSANKDAKDAGQLIDPVVSVPRAIGTKPAATPTADPADEPHDLWFANYELARMRDVLWPFLFYLASEWRYRFAIDFRKSC